MRPTALLIVLATLAACGPSRAFLKEGRAAAATQDWERAYRAYDKVLDRKPTQGEALIGRSKAQERVLAMVDEALERAHASGDLDGVADLLQHVKRFDAPPEWVRTREQRWADAWVQRLESEASAASRRASLGERYVWLDGLAGFTGASSHGQQRDAAWDELLRSEWSGMAVVGRGPGAGAVAQGMGEDWRGGPWGAIPVVQTSKAPWGVGLSTRQRACREEVLGTRQAVHEYVDGTMVTNPRIAELQSELRAADRSQSGAEDERRRRQRAEDQAFGGLQRADQAVGALQGPLSLAETNLRRATAQRERSSEALRASEDALRILEEIRVRSLERRSARDELRQRRDRLGAERDDVQSQLAQLEPALAQLRQQMAERKRANELAQTALTEAKQARAAAKATHDELLAQLEERDLEAPAQDARLAPLPKLRERLKERKAELEAAKQTLSRLEQQLATAEQAGDAASVSELGEEVGAAGAAVEAKQEQVSRVRDRILLVRTAKARRALDQARQQTRQARGEADARQAEVEALRPQLQTCRQQREQLTQRLGELDQKRSRTERRLADLREQGQQDRADRDRLAPLGQSYESRKMEFRRASQAFRFAAEALDELNAELDHRVAVRERAAADHEGARRARVDAARVASDWSERQAEIRRDLGAEPAQVELVKQAPYTVTRHRRTCVLTGELASWSPLAGSLSEPITLQVVSEDDSHPAWQRVGLRADAKRFDGTDVAALAGLDARARKQAFEHASEQVQREAQALRARSSRDRDRVTRDRMLAEYMDPTGEVDAYIASAYALPKVRP